MIGLQVGVVVGGVVSDVLVRNLKYYTLPATLRTKEFPLYVGYDLYLYRFTELIFELIFYICTWKDPEFFGLVHTKNCYLQPQGAYAGSV